MTTKTTDVTGRVLPAGTRLTRQRRAILEALRRTKAHPDARWIHEQVRQELPRISLGTVYRNLDFMTRSGAILQIATKESSARFDANTRLHGHIACTRCSRIDDVPLPRAVAELRDFGPAGYRDVEVKLEFEGTCPDCSG